MSTAFERYHMDLIASLPCVICGATSTEVHHLFAGHGKTTHDLLTASLCWSWKGDGCHRDAAGNPVVYSLEQELAMLVETWRQLPAGHVAEVKRLLLEDNAIVKRCQTNGWHELARILTENDGRSADGPE